MTETLAIDYAWQHPNPAAIKAAGYVGVVRYLSHDPSKDITAAEVKALHAAGLSIRLVYETTANRAGAGRLAGIADRREAEKRAAALGYPRHCPIFYAVDFDADPAKVLPYFKGVHRRHGFYVGVYGSRRVVEAVHAAGLANYLWQTEAWSGTAISSHAQLYQRVKPTHTIKGAKGGWDENVVLHPFPAWTPQIVTPPVKKVAAQKPAAKPPAAVTPTPQPGLNPNDIGLIKAILAFFRQLFGKATP
jgi:hypothetical protein